MNKKKQEPIPMSEMQAIGIVNQMCEQSLFPELFETWDKIKAELKERRRALKNERQPTRLELQLILYKMDFYKLESGFIAPVFGNELSFFETIPSHGGEPITREKIIKMIDES